MIGWVFAAGALVTVEAPVRAADGPLLVVVEPSAGAEISPDEVRQAIRAELGGEIIAPQAGGAPPARALVVAAGADHVTMSLLAAETATSRTIAAPATRAERLRAIAWLAGNLARDQVAPIVTAVPEDAPAAVEAQPPAPTPSSAISPPPFSAPTEGITTLVAAPHPVVGPPGERRWSLSLAYGPTAPVGRWLGVCSTCGETGFAPAWQLELQRRTPGTELWGVAVEGTSGEVNAQLLGAGAFIGARWRHGRLGAEATLGAGLELDNIPYQATVTTQSTLTGFSSATTTGTHLRPGVFGRGTLAAAIALTDSFEVLLRVAGHVSYGASGGDGFGAATVGLRYAWR